MFSEQITQIFGQFVEDGVIKCDVDVFRDGLQTIVRNYKASEKPKRKKTNFMIWLDKNRQSIKDEFFCDFDSQDDWSEAATLSYYESKSLPLEKITELIKQKKEKGKTEFKPRLVSLVTTKAGQMWSTLSDDEKSTYKESAIDIPIASNVVEEEDETNDVVLSESVSFKEKKKGRPKGKKPKSSVSDNAIMNTICDDEVAEVALEEFEEEGQKFLKDPDNIVYKFEDCSEIGKIVDGKIVLNE